TGTFSPNNPLSAFNGESSLGPWTLFVSDNAAGDTGNIQTWGITYSYSGGGGGNCSLTVAGQMGISSTPVGYFVEAGSQLGRLFRDGVATTCPNKPYPGNFNPAT